MSNLLWSLNQVLIRQPLRGTGKCIERYVDGSLWLPTRPMTGDLLRVHTLGNLDQIKIRVTSVELNAASSAKECRHFTESEDTPAGEIISSAMILLPTNPDDDDPQFMFDTMLDSLGAKSSPIKSEEIKPIDYERWLLDGCIADGPDEEWFDGMEDGEGYSLEFIPTKEGRAQFDAAQQQFLEYRRRQTSQD